MVCAGLFRISLLAGVVAHGVGEVSLIFNDFFRGSMEGHFLLAVLVL